MSIEEQIKELNDQFVYFSPNLKITTATVICKVPGIIFDIENIGLYFDDFDNIMIGKKYGDRKEKKEKEIIEVDNDNIISNILNNTKNEDIQKAKDKEEQEEIIKNENNTNIKKKRGRKEKNKKEEKKEKKKKNNFYNQVSFIFDTAELMGIKVDKEKLGKKYKPKIMNIKLFINGSIQMTGCKHFNNIIKVLEIIFKKIIKKKSVFNEEKKCFEEKCFVNSYDINELKEKKILYQEKYKNLEEDKFLTKIYKELTLGKVDKILVNDVKKFKTAMINTNFNIGFKINREELCKKMYNNNITVTYDSISHASVDSKIFIPHLNKFTSVFVFESGSITIAGSKSYEQIRYVYNFINNFILSHYHELYVKQITPEKLIDIIKNMS